MKSLLLSVCLCSCAYGVSNDAPQTYGLTYPPAASDASPPPDDPNADPGNDPIETGCFIQNIWGPDGQSAPPISYIVICDGRPFSVRDLVDPGPDGYKK